MGVSTDNNRYRQLTGGGKPAGGDARSKHMAGWQAGGGQDRGKTKECIGKKVVAGGRAQRECRPAAGKERLVAGKAMAGDCLVAGVEA
jgi:hypothetical protein